MRGFGIGLRSVRSLRRMSQREVARHVLGDVAERKIIDFANYMSRVERETRDARNPSLLLVEQYADALGLTLVGMLTEIEIIVAGITKPAARSRNLPLTPDATQAISSLAHSKQGDPDGSGPVSADVYRKDMERFRTTLASIEAQLRLERERVARLASRVDRPAPPRRKRAARG